MKLRNVIGLCILLLSSLPLFAGSPDYVPPAPAPEEQPLAVPEAAYYSPPPPYTGTNPSLDSIKQMLIAAGQKYQIPPQILFGIAFDESGWQQYIDNPSSPYNHRTKFDLELGGEIGVGIMQVTVYPSQSDYSRLCTDIAYNIDQGTAILAEKWNVTPIIGDNNRAKLENWYYAIWAYNGFLYGNVSQTNDPRYNSNPYQHRIIQYISQSPLNEWQSVKVTEPTIDEIGEPPHRIASTPAPVHIDANFDGIIDGTSQTPTTPPSVSFNEGNKNKWFGPNSINTQIVSWSLNNTGGGLGGFSQWWDNNDPGGNSPQFPNSTSGWLSFGSLSNAAQQGMHTVHVRTYNSAHSQSQVSSSASYGYDALPPTVTLTNDPGQGKVAPVGSWVAWNITDPDSGVSYWTQAWDNQTPQQYSTASGYLYIPATGSHTLHVHAWDNVGNNKDWTFGPYQVQSPTTIVYVDSATFTRQGPSQYWHVGSGYGLHGDMIWTYNNQSIVQNVGTWTPNLPMDGNYEVFVYIPRNYATTTSAGYDVYSASGTTQVRINQFSYNDQWVSLGTYHFHAGTSGRLDLKDQTGEKNTTKQVGFDAAEWVPR